MFQTVWLVEARREAVWDVLSDVLRWPQWWRGARSVSELEPGDARRVGSRYRVRWRARLPYTVEMDFAVDEVEAPVHMAGRASGDLTGTGVWALAEEGGLTRVTYDWDVCTTPRWMDAVALVARPVLARNHGWVMREGGKGLARELATAVYSPR